MKKIKIISKKLYKNDIRKLINWFLTNYGAIKTSKLVDKLKYLGFKFSTKLGVSLGLEDLEQPVIKRKLINRGEKIIERRKEKYLIGKISFIEYHEEEKKTWTNINNLLISEITKNFEQRNLQNSVYVMIVSGARGNLSQIKQLVGMRGLVSDAQGEIINTPIKNNLKEGIDICEYFISCYGARKGIIDTALKTANSGYLTRKLIYAAQQQTIKKPNCKTQYYIMIKNLKITKMNIAEIKKKTIGRVIAKNLEFTIEKKIFYIMQGQDICKYILKKLIFCKKIFIRSPLTCKLNSGICQLCYGWNLGNGRMAELGESIGIIAAQSIGEPGTQLTMRTFHTGGIVNIKTAETITAPCNGTIIFRVKKSEKRIIKTKFNEKGILTLKKCNLSILSLKRNKLTIKLPKYSILFAKNKEKIKLKQVIVETENLKKSNKTSKKNNNKNDFFIQTKMSGLIKIKKTESNNQKNLFIKSGNIFGMTTLRNIIAKNKKEKKRVKIYLKTIPQKVKFKEKKNISKNTHVKNFCSLKNWKKKGITKTKENTNYILMIKEKQEKLVLINKKYCKIEATEKIQKKLGSTIKYKQHLYNKNIICSQLEEKKINSFIITKINIFNVNEKLDKMLAKNILIKKEKPIILKKYKKGKIKDIVEGLPKIQQIFEANQKQKINEKLKNKFLKLRINYEIKVASRKSIKLIQDYLVKKLQKVYKNQGINVADKHFEVIIKQMTSNVVIKKATDNKLLNGEIINLNKLEKINEITKKSIKYEPIVVGISKLIKLNEGFISSASFQETTKVISKGSIEGKIDWLNGLKENIILGSIIPVGTGKKGKK